MPFLLLALDLLPAGARAQSEPCPAFEALELPSSLPVTEGAEPPPCYHLEDRNRPGLVVAGASLLGTGVIVPAFMIPLASVGPGATNDPMAMMLVGGLSTACSIVGAVLLGLGLDREAVWALDDRSTWTFELAPTRDGVSSSASIKF